MISRQSSSFPSTVLKASVAEWLRSIISDHVSTRIKGFGGRVVKVDDF
jgi:hypothetical protein